MVQQVLQEASLGLHYKKTAESLQENEEEDEWKDFKNILKEAASNQKKEEPQTTYSLEELLAEFRVVPAYEKMMAMVERGGDLTVLQPSNKIICDNRKLTFLLEKPSTDDMFIRIENNQKRKLFSQQIAPNLTTFTIDLPENLFSAGLYYWKLLNSEEMVIGSFIIP
ncbi:MAG: hypothetical protein ACPGVB_01770 [Chitinophagales bacterium]